MDASDGEKGNRKCSKPNWDENIALSVAEIVDKLILIEKSKKSINFNQLIRAIATKYGTANRLILVDIIDAIPSTYVNIKLTLLKTLYCDYLRFHPFSDDHPHNNNRFFNENSRIYRYYQPAKYRQKYQCCTSSMGEADEKVPEQSDFVRPFNGLCSSEFHVFMEFIFEQLKSSVEAADYKLMSTTEFQEFDFCLRSFFRCFKGLSLAKNQRKIILRIFEIIELLDDMKRNGLTEKMEQKFISESTISALMQVAGSFVLCNPKAIYLAKFFQLCYRGPLMMKLVLKTLHLIMENCYFEPGETLIFPQRELPTELLSFPLNSHLLCFDKRSACSFDLEKCQDINFCDGITISSWIKLVSNDRNQLYHILTIGCEDMFARVEIRSSTGAIWISVHSFGNMVLKEVFSNSVKAGGPWINFTLGFRYSQGILDTVMMVGNHLRTAHKQIGLALAQSRSKFSILLGEKSPADGGEHFIYEIATIFTFKCLLLAKYAIVLRSLGSACFSLTECRISQIYTSLLNVLNARTIVCSPFFDDAMQVSQDLKNILHRLQRALLFTWRPCSAYCYSVNVAQHRGGSPSEHLGEGTTFCLSMSKDLPVSWYSTIVQERCNTLDKSIRTIGSVKVFLFIYAMSVDREFSADVQAEAIHLLFLCLKRDPSYLEVFTELDGASILIRVLLSRNAHFNLRICQEFLNFLFTKLEPHDGGCSVSIPKTSELYASPRTVLLEPTILKVLFGSSEIWKGKRVEHFLRFLYIISESLTGNYVHVLFRAFTCGQLKRTKFLNQLLYVFLEMFQKQSSYEFVQKPSLNDCQSAVPPTTNEEEQYHVTLEMLLKIKQKRLHEAKSHCSDKSDEEDSPEIPLLHTLNIPLIMRNIVSELIDFDEIASLWNFLVLSHPVHDAYFDYSAKNHNEWICDELLGIGEEPEIMVGTRIQFELSSFLDEVLMDYTTEEIRQLWAECDNSIIAFRKPLLANMSFADEDLTTQLIAERRADKFQFCRMNSVDYPPLKPVFFNPTNTAKGAKRCVEREEHWLVKSRAELLDLMSTIVLNSEDRLMSIIEHDVLHWQTILVLLSNQENEKIRTYTFNLLRNFLLRCSAEHRSDFTQKHGFILVCNELRKSQASSSIADALFSLTCGEHVCIGDGLDTSHLENIEYDSFKIASFYALFTLLEESVYDSALFWSVCSALQKIFLASNAPRRAMLSMGMVETMVNVLWKICFSKDCPPANNPMFSLLDCWTSLAQSIIIFCVPYKDLQNYSICENFLWLCTIAVWQCFYDGDCTDGSNKRDGDGLDRQLSPTRKAKLEQKYNLRDNEVGERAVRKAFCQVVYCWIDTIQLVLSDQFRPSANGGGTNNDTGSSVEEFNPTFVEMEENDWITLSSFSHSNNLKRKEFASLDEVSSRLLFGLNVAKNFFIYIQPPEKCSDEEETLFRFFVDIVLATWKRKNTNEKLKDEWDSVLSICKEGARTILAELIAFLLYPADAKLKECHHRDSAASNTPTMNAERPLTRRNGESRADSRAGEADAIPWPLRRRLIMIRYLGKEVVQNRYYVETLLDVNLDYQYAMKIALHELALSPRIVRRYDLSEYNDEFERLVKFLRRIQIKSPFANLNRDEISSLSSDENLLILSYFRSKTMFCEQMSEIARLVCDSETARTKFTSDTAMTLTCEIAEYQNAPRRLFIQWGKEATSCLARAGNVLENLVRELCHPHAAFYDPLSWPVGRALETTESPCRERRRLTQSHYQFPTKFLQSGRREAADRAGSVSLPLENILQNRKEFKSLDHVEAVNQVRKSLSAVLLRTAFECSGEMVISDRKLYFLGEHAKSTQKGFIYAPVTYSFSYEQIREIHIRSYLLKDLALEIFTTTGDAFLIIFSSTEERSLLLNELRALHQSNLIVDYRAQLASASQAWMKQTLTNFEYLMILNKLAGRSFNDLMQYPVFPFIFSDYTSSTIDLNSLEIYRDLSRPIAIQDAKMESVYVHNYNSLLEEYRRRADHDHSSVKFGPYHYGSHYSNTGIVAYYLVRVSPYTSVALEYQDNSFDVADRLFNSIETTWRLSSSESTTDFKELIPEFFFFPEMFQNLERLDLGYRQDGYLVDCVNLPPWNLRAPRFGEANGDDVGTWTLGDARLFCLVHRQALESATVTATLNHWIDLIFGFKQSGEAAIKAVNMYHPATYRGNDLEGKSRNDELSLSAVRTMVRTYGQMPLQLFSSPHLRHLTSRRASSSTSATLHQQQVVMTTSVPSMVGSVAPSSSASSIEHFASCAKALLPQGVVLQQQQQQSVHRFFPTVGGLRWGDYCGSPDVDRRYYSSPSFTFRVSNQMRINHLTKLYKDGEEICYGLPVATDLIAFYKSDRKDALRQNFELVTSAFLSWRFSDNVLRIKANDSSTWTNLIGMQSLELACLAFSSRNNHIYTGFKCGLIRVYSLGYVASEASTSSKWSIELRSELFAHDCAITSLSVSDEFHVLLSTSVDAKICLWDINRLEFLSTFTPPTLSSTSSGNWRSIGEETVTLSCISPTSADVAVCLQSGHASRILLFTINGYVIGTHEVEETITCMAMTNVPEGTGINCFAVGLVSGVIRLVEMWTMNVVRELTFSDYGGPITSIAFTNMSKRLYAVVAGTEVLCLQVPSASSGRYKKPVFRELNPFE